MLRTIFVALVCVNVVLGQRATAPAPAATATTAAAPGPARTSGSNGTTTTAQGPVAFAPTGAVDRASAPNPAASARLRTGNYALDSLASTPTSYNQIQVCCLYASTRCLQDVSYLEPDSKCLSRGGCSCYREPSMSIQSSILFSLHQSILSLLLLLHTLLQSWQLRIIQDSLRHPFLPLNHPTLTSGRGGGAYMETRK